MLNEERAARYIILFDGYGDRWRANVPVDSIVKGNSVYLSGIRLDRGPDGTWFAFGDNASKVHAFVGALKAQAAKESAARVSATKHV
jgi:hypothetical protein